MALTCQLESDMPLTRIALAIITLSFAQASIAGPTEDFHALLDEAWEWQLQEYPMFASRLGDRRYNDQWTDNSLAAVKRRQSDTREFLQRAYAIDRSALSEADQLNHELFRRSLQDQVDQFEFNGHLMPFYQRGGVQNLDSNVDSLRFETVSDYEDWIARLAGIDAVIEQTIDLADAGIKAGLVSPRVLMERLPNQIAAQLADDPEDSPFWKAFVELPDSISADDQERLRAMARETIDGTVLPAYRELDNYFNKTYLPASRDSIGWSELPNGKEWYELRARQFTTTQMTPDEIHRVGLNEVARIRGEMQAIIDSLDFDGDFQDFLEFLRTDSQFYYDNPDDLYQAYLATSKRIDPELVKLFGYLPRMPYGVKPIPDSIAPDTTTAYYSRPAADGSRAGTYWVNLYKPEVRPKYEIEVLSVHEAMPGHHLQIAIQQELGDMPDFRRFMGFTAFVEGWGLYSESLGPDLGLYKDPYSKFGALTYEMWRAVRLVVDTGMH